MDRIYLDNAATTPLSEEVIDAMVDVMTVSYTHLDVYKRQSLNNHLSSINYDHSWQQFRNFSGVC